LEFELEKAVKHSRAATAAPAAALSWSWRAWLAPRIPTLRRLFRVQAAAPAAAPAKTPAPPTAAPEDVGMSPLDKAAGREARGALAALLDRHPMARNVLPALARLERRLGRMPVDGLPGELLRDCCEQLDSLLDDDSTWLLWELRDHMHQALRTHHPQLHVAASAPRAALQVEECSLTAFMDASRDLDRRLEAPPAA
jgi:hypothetical protein